MSEYPLVSVLFITYRRVHLLEQTLDAFLRYTTYPRERLELIVCDDGSPAEVQSRLHAMPFDIFLLSPKNQGMGANTNQGLKRASGEFILQLQDDWLLTEKSDYLQKGVTLLSALPQTKLAMLRFAQTDIFDFEPTETHQDIAYKRYAKQQTNPYLSTFLYSDHPHLKRRSFHKELGMYGLFPKMEQTELDMCARFNKAGWQSAQLVGYERLFEHIGEAESFRGHTLKDKVYNQIKRLPFGEKTLATYSSLKRRLLQRLR